MRSGRSDEALMLLFRKGDRDAFEELFGRHHRKVVHFCFRMTGDPARAEEAAQEVFLRVARAAPSYEPTAKFTTWLYTIARRTTLNVLRDEGGDEEVGASFREGEEGPEGDLLAQAAGPEALQPETLAWGAELQGRLAEALRAIPEAYRSAFVLNRGEGLSYDETAAVLGITVQAVKSRIFRAREMLLARLGGFLK